MKLANQKQPSIMEVH